MNHYTGEISALLTAFLWSLSALAWSHAGKRVGSSAVTAIRVILAAVMMAAIHLAMFGSLYPHGGATQKELWLLVVSGVLGVGIGDMLLFNSLKLVGPRIGMLLASATPGLTAVLAWVLPPNENLGTVAFLGIAMTMFGVGWVALEEPGPKSWEVPKGELRRGMTMGGLAVIFFSFSFLLARTGMGSGRANACDPMSGAFIRVVSGTVFTWCALPFIGRFRKTVHAFKDYHSMRIITMGTIVGPVIGIYLMMVAMYKADAGVATALINTGPLFMLPLVFMSHGEKPSWRSFIGTAIAVAGVALLVLRDKFQ